MLSEKRIAIVEDDPDAAETLAEFFKGSKVTIYDSCEKLLRSDEVFDAVVTDTNLGFGMSGFKCAEKIRGRMEGAVIVGTSGVDPDRDVEYRKIYMRSGANDFINRREGSKMIVERVMELLSIRGPST